MANNLKFRKNDDYISYNDMMKALAKKPSLSKQVEMFINYKATESTLLSKRFVSAYYEAKKAKCISFKDICESIGNKYKADTDFSEKAVSYYYMSQAITKALKKCMFNENTPESVRNCIARFFRAQVIAKDTKAVLYNSAEDTEEIFTLEDTESE